LRSASAGRSRRSRTRGSGTVPWHTRPRGRRWRRRGRRARFAFEASLQESSVGGAQLIQQLRIYEIFEHNKAAFHARFRDHAMRIMKRYGFNIVSMWESRTGERTEFVYLLTWPDLATKEEAWRRYLADPEWVEIKRVTKAKYGDLVGEIE